MTRAALLQAFLEENGLQDAKPTPLAGDASARRYFRLLRAGVPYVLMDDPSEAIQPRQAFIDIASHLRAIGLSAPEIISHDLPNGFILMEDLGDTLFAREIDTHPACENRLYFAAIDIFDPLHAAPPLAVPRYDAKTMAAATDLAFLWYRETPTTKLDPDALQIQSELRRALQAVDIPPALSLRDYHAENLIWLPNRTGHAQVGLLDFQDAVLTHPIYDLVSLTRDARRDVSPDVAQACLQRFAEARGGDIEALTHAAAVIAVQRNLRILGIFARLSRKMGKLSYVDLIPRVWAMLLNDLEHPELTGLRRALLSRLPAPDSDFLNQLRTPCPTR
ncbi:phosphotransferase [Aliiroseovarius sp. KMU-50]|uniref:Phosphotransferase n=1 Tax=Aliiroseovarius salicola TaxID=3009082 RepID=A0ABT4VXG0_9RHOB|nr:phosphotransferase [Aliiroseovarius sp. KMU-50]MDA5092939.1 phosphotransferase [Aliiroseovarius sp. KMU-50]